MPLYDFVCDPCHKSDREDWNGTVTVRASMSTGPETPECHFHGPMRRLYAQQKPITVLDSVGYIEKAYRGEEIVPSLTTAAVRAMVDNDTAHSRKGRSTNVRRQRRIVR